MRKYYAKMWIKKFIEHNYREDQDFVKDLNHHITSLSHRVYKGHGLHGHSNRQEIRNELWGYAMTEVLKAKSKMNPTQKKHWWERYFKM